MSVSGTAEYIETTLYAIKDTNENQIISKIYQGPLKKPPMAGKYIATIHAGKYSKLIDIPQMIGPKDVPFFINIYMAGPLEETSLKLYDLADTIIPEIEAEMDNFNGTCTSSHVPDDYVLFGDGQLDNSLVSFFTLIIICNYSNNE